MTLIDRVPDSFAVPDSWKFPLTMIGAMVVLAALDFAGALFAKEWSTRGHTLLLVGGLASFSVLFIVYARILQTAELSVVTLGWVVFLQVGIIAMDRLRYGVMLPWPKWAAVILILALQGYLMVGPSAHSSAQETPAPSVELEAGE
jgi:hypothetical protein